MKFKSKVKNENSAEISTASLPDIVFLLLFFFMVSATIKTKDDKVTIEYPKALALSQVDQRSLIREISIGIPKNHQFGKEPSVEVEGKIIRVNDISQWAFEQRESLPEAQRDQMIVMLKVDRHVSMGMVSDIQEKLKEVNARKVLYRTLEKSIH